MSALSHLRASRRRPFVAGAQGAAASSRPRRTARAAVPAGAAALPVRGAPGAFAPPGAAGAVAPATGFPSYVADAAGPRLDLCLDSPNCLAASTDLTAPDGEAFWWNSEATMPTSGGAALLVLAAEAGYRGGTAGTADALRRGRFRHHLPKAGPLPRP